MAIRVKDIGTIAKKFVSRASAAAGDYKAGVEAAGQDWQTATAASGDNYAQGVTQAMSDKRFEAGVQRAGAAKFASRAGSLGAQRFAPGVAAAESEYQKNMAPVLQVIAGVSLPPRRPKGDPGNFARSQAIAVALRQHKVGR